MFGCPFQDRRRHAPFFFTGRARKFQRRQLRGDFLEDSCRARFHALGLQLRPKRQLKPRTIKHMQRQHFGRLDQR